MKKIIIAALSTIVFISSSFAAGENKINKRIKTNFECDFKNVQQVKWNSGESFVTATFNYNDKGTQAFYDFQGNLLGSAYAVTVDNLPLFAKRALARKYKDYIIKEAISFRKEDEKSFFVSLTNSTESIILQVSDSQVSLYKKLK